VGAKEEGGETFAGDIVSEREGISGSEGVTGITQAISGYENQ
jgi:hypothetical protein